MEQVESGIKENVFEYKRQLNFLELWLKRMETKDMSTASVHQYAVRDEKGRSCQVVHTQYVNDLTTYKVSFIEAVDDEGNLLGIKQIYEIPINERVISLRGDVEILNKGKGVASLLESYGQEFVNRISKKNSENTYVYLIEDVHMTRLRDLRFQALDQPDDPSLKSALEEAEQERVAWEHLYVPGGRFGYTVDKRYGLCKIFNSNTKFRSLAEVHEVEDKFDPVAVLKAGVDKFAGRGLK